MPAGGGGGLSAPGAALQGAAAAAAAARLREVLVEAVRVRHLQPARAPACRPAPPPARPTRTGHQGAARPARRLSGLPGPHRGAPDGGVDRERFI